ATNCLSEHLPASAGAFPDRRERDLTSGALLAAQIVPRLSTCGEQLPEVDRRTAFLAARCHAYPLASGCPRWMLPQWWPRLHPDCRPYQKPCWRQVEDIFC